MFLELMMSTSHKFPKKIEDRLSTKKERQQIGRAQN